MVSGILAILEDRWLHFKKLNFLPQIYIGIIFQKFLAQGNGRGRASSYLEALIRTDLHDTSNKLWFSVYRLLMQEWRKGGGWKGYYSPRLSRGGDNPPFGFLGAGVYPPLNPFFYPQTFCLRQLLAISLELKRLSSPPLPHAVPPP